MTHHGPRGLDVADLHPGEYLTDVFGPSLIIGAGFPRPSWRSLLPR
jgi:hypothetical protein